MQKVETERTTVYLVEESELSGLKKYGRQMRAQCPVHHSRDRDLVLVPYNASGYLSEEDERRAGIGHCKSINCGAIVRVIEWNPDAASRLLGCKVKTGTPRHSITSQDEDKAEEWQQRELAALNKIYDTATSALRHFRCHAYLAQRGLGSDDALALLERLGVGYIPPSEDWKKAPPFELLKWCDRIIFPFTTRSGERGYIGRTLMLWTPGMDENEHKRRLHEHDAGMEEEYGLDAGKHQIRRWRKTYRSGFFNASALEHRHIVLTEGAFDAIPLMLAGLVNVIAIAGTELDVEWLRNEKRVMEATLAFDADTSGKKSIEKIIDRINETGITAHACSPPDDGKGKDWSERYRLAGIDGLAPVMSLFSLSESDEKLIGNPDTAQDLIASTGDTTIHPASVGVPSQYQASTKTVPDPKQTQSRPDFNDFHDTIEISSDPAQDLMDDSLDEDQLAVAPLPDACTVCGSEVTFYSDDGRPWCDAHSPSDPVIQAARDQFQVQVVEVIPVALWPQRKDELLQEARARIAPALPRAPILQWMIDYWITYGQMPDYWTILEEKLARKDYHREFKETEQALLNRVATPRVYTCPVPRYELVADERGVMHLVTAGYWPEQSQEVSA